MNHHMNSFILLLAVLPGQFDGAANFATRNVRSESRLEFLLSHWEKAVQNVHTAHCFMELTNEDKELNEKDVVQIEGFVVRPKVARLDMKNEKGKPKQILIWNDRTLLSLEMGKDPEELPAKGWAGGFLDRMLEQAREMVFFDFPVSEIQNHFDIRLGKEDKNWAYIKLVPKMKERQSIIREMEVVIDQKTHLPRQYRVIDINGNRSIYDFQKLEINPRPAITLECIYKDLPKGFKEISLPK